MFDVYRVEIGSPQRAGLRARRSHEFMRGHRDRGDAKTFESNRVVQTARRTRSSIGQGFDHRRAFGVHELVDHCAGRGLGERRLHNPHDPLHAVAVFQRLF